MDSPDKSKPQQTHLVDLEHKAEDKPNVDQSPELTKRAEHAVSTVDGGVGPQPDEHRGNAIGGFKYDEIEEHTAPKEGRSGDNGCNSRDARE
jgi:hypothetical protein